MKKITEELLKKQDACMEEIEFFKRNKLYLFNFDYVNKIEGDYKRYFNLIKDKIQNYKYDKNNNKIEHKYSNGNIETWKYDENNNLIEHKNSNGCIISYKYDKNNNMLEYRDSNGYIETWKYDGNNMIENKDSTGYIATWKYDENNNMIEYKDSKGFIETLKYDKNNNITKYRSSNGINYNLECKFNKQGMLLQIKKNNKIILSIPDKMIEES